MKQSDKSKSQQRREAIEHQTKKLNKKDVKALLAPHIVSITETGKGQDKLTVVIGRNYLGNRVVLKNRKEDKALKDLATLNGYTVE